MKFRNPIVTGYYPDPSVCRVDNKYYMVCSSFQYFPGVPLFESDDLINWTQIGYCLTRKSQLPLETATSSGGIFAPTIRYNDGHFYMTTTNTTTGGNFFVWTDDIHGEWSDPIYIDQEGIDPSLYFENGKAYFMSNGADSAILQCEIDIKTGEKLSEGNVLWRGTGGRYPESPHLYKIGEYYYLMLAEGGTEYGHMVTYARSKIIDGPYTPYAKNPVLTNRNKGGYSVQAVGHADLIQDTSGNWWMYHLGFRQIDRWLTYHHLGREVFLMPVQFDDDGWFTVGDDGTTTATVETDRISDDVIQKFILEYTFKDIANNPDWQYLRNYNAEDYILGEDSIKLRGTEVTIDEPKSPTFICLHQKEFDMELTCDVKIAGGEAGVTVYMDQEHHYDIYALKDDDGNYAVVELNIGNINHIAGKVKLSSNTATLKITSNAFGYTFNVIDNGDEVQLGYGISRYLSSEVAMGFTGVVLGFYSQNSNGEYNEFSNLSCKYTV